MTILKRILSGTFWTALGTYINLVLSLVVTAILARLLNPSDFGIVGMVYVYSGFMSLIANAGLNGAVVQKQELSKKDLSTVFWFSLVLGGGIIGFTYMIAPFIECFFAYPNLALVVRIMSLNLFIMSFSNVPSGILRKELRFKTIAFINVLSACFAGILAIVLALNGFGYWSLVVQSLTVAGLVAIGSFFCCNWFPNLSFNFTVLKSVFSYSNYLLGFNCINYWARNSDNLLIGKFLGAMELGFYNQAYKLMTLPIRLITNAVTPSLHPIFAGIQDDIEEIKHNYFRVLEIIALFAFPLGVYFIVYGDVVIRVLWGDKFLQSIPIFRILALLTMTQPLVSTSGSIFLACNRADLLFRLGSVNAIVMVAGITIGLMIKGSVGVATGYAFSYISIVLPLTSLFLLKTLKAPKKDLLVVLRKPFALALFFFFSLQGIKFLTSYSLSIWSQFFLTFFVSGVLFTTFCFMAYKELSTKIISVCRGANSR